VGVAEVIETRIGFQLASSLMFICLVDRHILGLLLAPCWLVAFFFALPERGIALPWVTFSHPGLQGVACSALHRLIVHILCI